MSYVKYIDQYNIQYPPKNDLERGIMNYDLNIELLIEDGYKEFIPHPPEPSNRQHHIEYFETENTVEELIVYHETQEEADERVAQEEKEEKEKEINQKIEELEKMAQYDILYNNQENIQVYRDVINGLENTRDNL